MDTMNVAVCGMSHLGLVYSTAFAAKGVPTLCYDADRALIERLQGGHVPVDEPGLAAGIVQQGKRQRFTANAADIKACDIVYIARDIATDDRGNSDLSAVHALIDSVIPHLHPKAILVVLCQVTPGFTRALSRKIPNPVYYQVETLVFGLAMERALSPERYIVGVADPALPLDGRLQTLLGLFHCPILAMRYESAELSKIAINLFLISSVSVSNLLAEMCEKIGADWSEIKPALHLDKRIGAHAYLKPGLGISGGNLERDMMSIVTLGGACHTDTRLVAAWMENSAHRKRWVLERLQQAYPALQGVTVAVWGLAYKENTDSIKNSPAVATIQALPQCRIQAHDPAVPPHRFACANMERAAQPLEALSGADALLIMTPWNDYKNYPVQDILQRMKGNTIMDPYGVLALPEDSATPFTVHVMGKPPIHIGAKHVRHYA